MKRVHIHDVIRSGLPDEPFFLDVRAADIPETIEAMIRSLPERCKGVSLRTTGGPEMVRRANQAAQERNLRIVWFGYPTH